MLSKTKAVCEASGFEEPGAVIPHAGICEGAVGQPAVLPRCSMGLFLKMLYTLTLTISHARNASATYFC